MWPECIGRYLTCACHLLLAAKVEFFCWQMVVTSTSLDSWTPRCTPYSHSHTPQSQVHELRTQPDDVPVSSMINGNRVINHSHACYLIHVKNTFPVSALGMLENSYLLYHVHLVHNYCTQGNKLFIQLLFPSCSHIC